MGEAADRRVAQLRDKELFQKYVTLVRNAQKQPLPFFGDGLEFRQLFQGKLAINADPQAVEQQLPPVGHVEGKPIRFDAMALGRGDWSAHLNKVTTAPIYREVADVLAGGDIRQSKSYRAIQKRAAEGNPVIRYLTPLDSEAAAERYYAHVAKLANSIRSFGYRVRGLRNIAMAETHGHKLATDARPIGIELGESEVGLAVGADGTLIRLGPGNHRFAIARQLGLTSIRVEIRLFHVRFLRDIFDAEGTAQRSSIIEAVRRLAAPAPELAAATPTLQTSSEDATP